MIGILTFYWADDYGAMLQVYALKTYLEEQGETVEVIPYAPLKLRGRYQLIPVNAVYKGGKWKTYRDFWGFCWKLCFAGQFYKRRTSMRSFRKRYLTGKRPIEDAQKLRLSSYKVVFVGSDQVWNSDNTFGLDDAYMGNIEKRKSCRLVAYGASFGKSEPPRKEWEEFECALNNNFAAVSLREREGADFAERLLKKPVADVLDPVLLLDRNKWEELGRKPQEKEYILLYITEYQENMFWFIKNLSKETGRPVIQLSVPLGRKHEKEFQLRMDAGPEEFVGYFQHASCVITNSFHGLAFSILFERQFLVFQHSAYHARLKNLLEKLSLEQRLIKQGATADMACMEKAIDWLSVRKRLLEERERSERFIREGIKTLCKDRNSCKLA